MRGVNLFALVGGDLNLESSRLRSASLFLVAFSGEFRVID
jgi:hypothetical protein